MKQFLAIISLLFLQNCIKTKNNEEINEKFYQQNDLQFTFLVFDNEKLDNFFENHQSFDYKNTQIENELKKLSEIGYQKQNTELEKYSNNTKKIEISDYELAKNVINSSLSGNKEYWNGCLDYLLFSKTLPEEIQQKWIQTHLGNFEFNITFLALLREKNKKFDDLIYGKIYNNDKRLERFNSEFMTNEITSEIAQNIKKTIETDKNFDDIRFKKDKKIFLEFLDKTIEKKWKLILLDWN